MDRQGRCPSCFRVHSISLTQTGSTIRCACGETLFVCDAKSFTEIPVRCPECRESYFADPEDIGQILECECGAEIEVLNTVLQKPMLRDPDSDQPAAGDPLPHDDFPAAVVAADGDDASEKPKSKRHSRSGVPWLPLASGIAVALLFMTALVMFVTRDPGISESDSGGQVAGLRGSVSAADRAASVDEAAAEKRIDPGKIAQLIARIPTPETSLADIAPSVVSADRGGIDEAMDSDRRSPYGDRTAARKTVLPLASEARPVIPVIEVAKRSRIFDHAYQQAFESYEAFTSIEEADSDDYRTKLGETLSVVRHAYTLALKTEDPTRLFEITYLLAYLYHRAGHLMAASIFGEAAARWGSLDDPATKESLMIALAATQEAVAIQWGDPEQVGELGQMQALAELLDRRWPEDPQRDEIWMTLAQNYSAFNRPQLAAQSYQQIQPGSDHYIDAQLGAGSEVWDHFIDRASAEAPNAEELVALLKSASRHLETAVRLMAADKAIDSRRRLAAKLTLAKIADRLGQPEAVLKWLEGGTSPLVEEFTASDQNAKSDRNSDPQMAQTLFALLYHAKYRIGDSQGAREAISRLAEWSGTERSEEVSRLLSHAAIEQMKATSAQPAVDASDVEALTRLFEMLDARGTSRDVAGSLWFGEAWAGIAEKCDSAALTQACYLKAADAYQLAIEHHDLAAGAMGSAVLRRSELLRRAGKLQASLDSLSDLLEENPNVIELQLQAAMTLQQIAFQQGNVAGLVAAIRGPSHADQKRAPSPIWGWEKLVAFLYKLRYSEQGTQQHALQLLESQFHLARCRWILANALGDSPQRDELIATTKSQLRQLIATIPLDDFSKDPWRKGFEAVLQQLDAQQG